MKIQGRKFVFWRTRQRLPNGVSVQVDQIEHPGAALILPLIDKNHVIMLRQYRVVLQRYLFELPAGTLDKGEQPLQCARRELTEETGYAARYFKKLGSIYPVPGYSDEVIYIYQAEGLSPRLAHKDADEILHPHVFSRLQVQRMFRAGKIRDAKTICGLTLAGWL